MKKKRRKPDKNEKIKGKEINQCKNRLLFEMLQSNEEIQVTNLNSIFYETDPSTGPTCMGCPLPLNPAHMGMRPSRWSGGTVPNLLKHIYHYEWEFLHAAFGQRCC